jgi:insulin-like growth factor 2 receptor
MAFLCSAPRKLSGSGAPDDDETGDGDAGRNLGMWAKPRLYEGELYMSTDGGDQPGMFDDDGENADCAPARIIYKCDLNAGIGAPRLIKTSVNKKGVECGTVFEWITASACPLRTTPGQNGACTVNDPTYGFLYNMNPLSANGAFSVNTTSGGSPATYNLNGICAAAQQSAKQTMTAIGDGSKVIRDLGSSDNTLIRTKERNVELQFSNGEDCIIPVPDDIDDDRANETTVPFSTTVRFVCNEDISPPNKQVSIIEETQCSVVFGVATALACPPQTDETSCIVDDPKTGNLYDLSVLSRRHKAGDKVRTKKLESCKPRCRVRRD